MGGLACVFNLQWRGGCTVLDCLPTTVCPLDEQRGSRDTKDPQNRKEGMGCRLHRTCSTTSSLSPHDLLSWQLRPWAASTITHSLVFSIQSLSRYCQSERTKVRTRLFGQTRNMKIVLLYCTALYRSGAPRLWRRHIFVAGKS